MERKAARGEWTGGSVPFGYRLDQERRFLILDPHEAPIVQEVYRRYAERLHGSAAIAKWLTERGYRTKRSKPFQRPSSPHDPEKPRLPRRDLLPRVPLPRPAPGARRRQHLLTSGGTVGGAGRGRLAQALNQSEYLLEHAILAQLERMLQ